jgi:hypothetical protein
MSAEEAKDHVRAIHKRNLRVAFIRLMTFDTMLLRILNAMPAQPAPPNLLHNNPAGLDQAGLLALKKLICFSGFTSLVCEVGSPYIFDIDLFTEEVSLNGPTMKKTFIQHYS